MNTDIKQAMHVEAGKSFGTSEANENERHWNDDKIDRKNQDPTNHYDKTRMKLNFEIGLETFQAGQQNSTKLLCEIYLRR